MTWRNEFTGLLLAGSFLSGCASVALNRGFEEVQSDVERRTRAEVVWNNGSELDRHAAEKVRSLLARSLSANDAVQIALLNNRDLQAAYSDLGVAQADLVQAGLLSNPIFDASIMFPVRGGGRPDLEFGAAMNFLNIFYIPLRRRVAAARFEETKTRITGTVLDFAGRVLRAFYNHEADEQMLELRRTVVEALAASFELSRRLQEAGNLSDLDFARERAESEAGKIALRAAEIAARQSREELNVLMGLWGEQLGWQSRGRLPAIEEPPSEMINIERLAMERSIEIAAARQRWSTEGEQLGLARWTALVPELSAGPNAERNDGAWEVGPKLDFLIPLFDQGQARNARVLAELRRIENEYYALAVRVRAQARAAGDRLEGAADHALYYRDILLPLHERIVNESQLQYNAMQLSPLQLLRARERQIETAVSYIGALRDYWLARADVDQLLRGRLPAGVTPLTRGATAQSGRSIGEGH
jgi:cobalt-zinc-cadmium efflux system outer membrane protein